MAERMYQQRIWKVSKDLDRLALMCENHHLQIDHRQGLPDWTTPPRPAGVSSRRHTQAPTYFAWHEKSPEGETQPPPQSEEPRQAVPTTPESGSTPSTPTRASAEPAQGAASECDWREDAPHPTSEPVAAGRTSETRLDSAAIMMPRRVADPAEDERKTEESAIIVDSYADEAPSNIVPAAGLREASSAHPAIVEDSPPPRRMAPSPRYRHGRRLQARDQAMAASPRAGISTREADRLRMLRSSGKVICSPAKRSLLWDESPQSATDTYHHSSGRQRTPSTVGASDTFRTAYMDSYGWPRTESSRGERRPVLSGTEAMQVANNAAREFLGVEQEEHYCPGAQRNAVQNESINLAKTTNSNARIVERTPSTARAAPNAPTSTANSSKTKTVSFAENGTARAPTSRAPGFVLIDSTTQTEDEAALSAQISRVSKKQARPISTTLCDCCEAHRRHHTSDWCSVCGGGYGEPNDRPRKAHRTSPDSPGSAPPGPAAPEAAAHAHRRYNHHLTNPILANPRYPPEPQIFRARSTYMTDFADRPSWR